MASQLGLLDDLPEGWTFACTSPGGEGTGAGMGAQESAQATATATAPPEAAPFEVDVGAELLELPVAQHRHAVGANHARQPMSDDNGGAPTVAAPAVMSGGSPRAAPPPSFSSSRYAIRESVRNCADRR